VQGAWRFTQRLWRLVGEAAEIAKDAPAERPAQFGEAATTLRKQTEPPLVIDGPFAETKEQLLGFFIIECASLDEAVDTAKELGQANPGGSYEIRPLLLFKDNKV